MLYLSRTARCKGVGTPNCCKNSNNNKLCINCHGESCKDYQKGWKVQIKHAKHVYSTDDVGGGLCTGCYMPKTAKTAVDNDISSHVFDIIKPYTSKAMADANTAAGTTNSPGTVITNSCYGCHSDEDTDYSVERWNKWEKKTHKAKQDIHINYRRSLYPLWIHPLLR